MSLSSTVPQEDSQVNTVRELRQIASRSVFAVAASLLIGLGCTQRFDMKAEDEDRIVPGLSQSQFLEMFPSARDHGSRVVAGHPVSMYELNYHTSHRAVSRNSKRDMYFVFAEGKLMQWSEDDDWPKAEDVAAVPWVSSGAR
jgi:hypothetical protein